MCSGVLCVLCVETGVMITVSAYMCVVACHAMYLILQCHGRLVHAFVLVYTSVCCVWRPTDSTWW